MEVCWSLHVLIRGLICSAALLIKSGWFHCYLLISHKLIVVLVLSFLLECCSSAVQEQESFQVTVHKELYFDLCT